MSKLMNFFEIAVMPANEQLDYLLGIKHVKVNQEHTETPIRVHFPPKKVTINAKPSNEGITVQSGFHLEGEFILENCNHGGAREEITSMFYFDEDSQTYQPTGIKKELICDKENCQARYIPGEMVWEV